MTLTEFRAAVKAAVDSRLDASCAGNALPSVAEQIANTVKRRIVKGELRPGERVAETELAARFDVSRAPVRDALRILHKEGFVALTPRRGAQVYLPTAADVSDLYEVRAELFALAARKAAAAMDTQLLGIMASGLSLLVAMTEDGNAAPLDFLKVRSGLAMLILTAANNPKLTASISVLATQAVMHTRSYESPTHRRRNLRGWERLREAIADHDGERAATEARLLVSSSRDELLLRLRQEPAPVEEPPRRSGFAYSFIEVPSG